MQRTAHFIAACLAIISATCVTQDAQDAEQQAAPPNPFTLGQEQREKGNPLPALLELLSLEHAYHDAGQTRLFHDARATLLASLGDTQGAMRSWAEISHPKVGRGPLLDSPLDSYTAVDAIDLIVAKADEHNIIMIGEEHVQPQTRCILKPLLQRLYDKGFRYFAAETFRDELDATVNDGHARLDTGYYTREPVFAEAVTEALRLGYTLVPYECRTRVDSPPDDPMRGQNHRESEQARHLKERTVDLDPDAKVIVWAGRSHVSEEAGEVPGVGQIEFMAYKFREMTGIDPFTVYLPAGAEQARRDHEFSFYRYATHQGWVEQPTIFVDDSGETFGISGDALMFFPRVQLKQGRPDWLTRDLGRVHVPIPRELLFTEGHQLVQAFHVEDFENAVPIDQILIAPGDPVPVLCLPPAGNYLVRCIGASAEVRGPVEVRTPARD